MRDILLICILSIVCLFLYFDHACTNRKLDVARNGHERQKITTVEVQLKADKEINDLQNILSKRDKEIEYLEKEVAEKDLRDVEKERKIEELEAEEEVLVGSGTKDSIIVNLRKQVNIWKKRFSLSQGIIAGKDKIIFSLRANYDIQVKITDAWISKFNAERTLRLSAEVVIKEALHEIRTLKVKSWFKTGGIAIVGGILLYGVLK